MTGKAMRFVRSLYPSAHLLPPLLLPPPAPLHTRKASAGGLQDPLTDDQTTCLCFCKRFPLPCQRGARPGEAHPPLTALLSPRDSSHRERVTVRYDLNYQSKTQRKTNTKNWSLCKQNELPPVTVSNTNSHRSIGSQINPGFGRGFI